MKSLAYLLKPLAVALVIGCSANLSAQIVQDGGFELSPGTVGTPGGFSPFWTLTPPAGTGAGQQLSNVGTNPSFAHSGTKHANLEFSQGTSTSFASLSQALTTIAGQAYNLNFWLANYVALPTNFFQVYWNGSLVYSTMAPPFGSTGVYQQITAFNLLATGTSTSLEFRYRHDQDYWYLDDISVSTPEGGATLWLAIPILGGLCLLHARLNRRGENVTS